MGDFLEKIFHLKEKGTNVKIEILAGFTTFLTMCYIIFVNPVILGSTNMDRGAVMFATCIGSAIATFLMGVLANYPIALAPGMGHNAFFAFIVCGAMGFTWQQALSANLVSGLLFLLLVLLGLSKLFIEMVPESLRHAIAVGIGLLLAMIGLQWGGFIKGSPATLVTLGSLSSKSVIISTFGFLVMAVLIVMRVRGAIIIGLLSSLGFSILFGVAKFQGILSPPPSPEPTFLAFDFRGLTKNWVDFFAVLFVFLFLDIFDTVGTLIGVSSQAGLLKNGSLPKVKEALFSDAVGTVAGVCLGTSTITSYIESSAGVSQGGRTGLTSVTVSLLFVLGLFLSPLVQTMSTSIPVTESFAQYPIIAPALILVGAFMVIGVRSIKWEDYTESIPAFLTLLVMPLTFSITEGIAFGFITYAILKIVAKRAKEVHWLLYILAFLFFVLFIIRTYLGG
ncbi:MAG: NCS2 family permease [Candidatus Aminicenantia bacterium]